MRELHIKSESVRKQLELLVRRTTSVTEYQGAMRKLGSFLGERIGSLVGRKQRGLVVCTPEDADYLAAGMLEALSSSIAKVSLACFWNHRTRPNVRSDSHQDLDVAPVIKRYEEPTQKSLDFIVVLKSIISSGCVVKHNLLDIIDRKRPLEIFVAAPVIYKGADSALRADFSDEISRRFRFVYFAQDDNRDREGIVSPGIGGNVYERLGLSEQRQKVPLIVKQRREHYQSQTGSHSRAERIEEGVFLKHNHFGALPKSPKAKSSVRAVKRAAS